MPIRPGGNAGPVMQRKHAFGRKALEETIVDHRLGAGVAFLAGLEDQVSDAVEVARLVQIAGGRQQHRRVAVVAAAVHASIVPGAVGEVVFFLHRQRVHVGAKSDPAAAVVAAARNDRDDTGAAHACVVLDCPGGKLIADEPRGAMLFETQLGMRVQVAADVGELIRPATDVLDRIGGRHDGRPRMMPNRPRSVNDTPTRDAKRASLLHPALLSYFIRPRDGMRP